MKHKPITKTRRTRLIQMHGDRCINCGSPDEIEWHHVVPLAVGGYDVDTNLVPLCYSCHKAVTHQTLILATKGRPVHSGGRKRTVPDNYKEIIDEYLHGNIGKSECIKQLGLGKNNRLTDNVWFKEYIHELEIKRHRNQVDLVHVNGCLVPGRDVGFIEYTDGRVERLCYKSENEFITVDEDIHSPRRRFAVDEALRQRNLEASRGLPLCSAM